jgi:chromosome segregation ATPase
MEVVGDLGKADHLPSLPKGVSRGLEKLAAFREQTACFREPFASIQRTIGILSGNKWPHFKEQMASIREQLPSFREQLASFMAQLALFREPLASLRKHLASSEESWPHSGNNWQDRMPFGFAVQSDEFTGAMLMTWLAR